MKIIIYSLFCFTAFTSVLRAETFTYGPVHRPTTKRQMSFYKCSPASAARVKPQLAVSFEQALARAGARCSQEATWFLDVWLAELRAQELRPKELKEYFRNDVFSLNIPSDLWAEKRWSGNPSTEGMDTLPRHCKASDFDCMEDVFRMANEGIYRPSEINYRPDDTVLYLSDKQKIQLIKAGEQAKGDLNIIFFDNQSDSGTIKNGDYSTDYIDFKASSLLISEETKN